MKSDELLKDLILERFGSIAKFARACGIPETTLFGIFRRGVLKSNVSSIIKMCKTLKISTDELIKGRIVYTKPEKGSGVYDLRDIPAFLSGLDAAQVDGVMLSKKDIKNIINGIEIVIEMTVRNSSENN